MSVVLQDEASGATTGGTIYLTNIHRLYDASKHRSAEPVTYDSMGPGVSKAKALDTNQALRERITSHPRLMVLNDEAHHVWDPDSAWNDAITFLNETGRKRGGGLIAQLDFSATPKDNKGNVFQHVICDTPLGEAVDGGIVKTPIIGHESTEAADQIAKRFNADSIYKELNGKTINLHTNLKGSLKKRGKGATVYYEFVESDKDISDEDLKALRKLSRELDDDTSPYRCIVSVLMLREGWDVRNVTTIVPLRPLTAASKILPEQTLGRGLRRMTPPGQAAEVVTVVEHKAFLDLYREQLSQEGLFIDAVDVEKIPRTTITIYPDAEHKDVAALDLPIPRLTQGYRIIPELGTLTFEDIRNAFKQFKPIPLGEPQNKEIQYEGRHLITDEIVQQMRIKLPLLADGIGAISFFREELERATNIRGTHAALAPLIQRFMEEVLFEKSVTLYDPRLIARLADPDVREHIRATFVPVIRQHTIRTQQRLPEETPQPVSAWKPYQVTHSERHPTVKAKLTVFNLVPCNRELYRCA